MMNDNFVFELIEDLSEGNFVDEFLQGQKDCQEGLPAKEDASDYYMRGYAAQYQHEQNQEYFSRGH